MKQQIEQLLVAALQQLKSSGALPGDIEVPIQIEPTKDKQHGDLASNLAMMLAKPAKMKPRDIAALLVEALPVSPIVTKVEIAGPGFINFYLENAAFYEVIPAVLKAKDTFGQSKIGNGERILVEYVSSNPTGPLHVGHGRHAAYGSIVCRLLKEAGFAPYAEYYVNDAGRQMDILTVSIWLRYLEQCGEKMTFPANGYRGAYVTTIASDLKAKHSNAFQVAINAVTDSLPLDEPQGGDKEVYIDAIVAKAKTLLGDKYKTVFDFGLSEMLNDIAGDLKEFGVVYDNWFSERELVATDVVDRLIEKLKSQNYVYEDDGALWFRATQFGDDKDRVLVRSNGQRTYFANDAAYHLSKFERGFDKAIDIFGSDHHGYVPRMKAVISALGIDPKQMHYQLGQFVMLYRGGEQVSMSTRGGEFVTLRELREEVGNDAARFFYVMRKYEQHIDFDLDLAKSQSTDNPVFYVQYAHARICSVLRQLDERGIKFDEKNGLANLSLLQAEHEKQLLDTMTKYTDTIAKAATQYEPHMLTNYMRDLAADFHAYYNAEQFIVDDEKLRDARLTLIFATRQILKNGFAILGISAPESM
jgi:arginyl-tRNA synthetase